MHIKYRGVSSVGEIRSVNQDNYYFNGFVKPMHDSNSFYSGESFENYQLFAICDGMGGEDSGEVAADIAVKNLEKYRNKEYKQNWIQYVREVNEKICTYQDEKRVRMGTTYAGLYLDSEKVLAVNIGDSRIYRIVDGKLIRLSIDHNEYQVMLDAGVKVDEKVKRKAQSRLTQHLGIPEDMIELEPHVVEITDIVEKEQYLLCSDGLSGVVEDGRICHIIQESLEDNEEDICNLLVEEALKNGSRDNITVIYVSVINRQFIDKQEIVEERIVEKRDYEEESLFMRIIGFLKNYMK